MLSKKNSGKERDKAKDSLEINPSVTVHALLEAYPELEDVLIGIAPPFKKLKKSRISWPMRSKIWELREATGWRYSLTIQWKQLSQSLAF